MTKTCKICSRETEHFFDTRMKSDCYHCKSCHFFFKDESAYLSSDDELALYKQHNNSFENEGYVQMFEAYIQEAIAPFEVHSILEFGSGPTPVLSELLKRKHYDVDIYDIFFSPLKVFEGKQYDLISSTEVIEHINDINEIMTFFNKHLREGGYLSLMTQFHQNSIKHFSSWWYVCDRTHISFFRPETFEVLARKFGFKVVSTDNKKTIVLQKVKTLS